MDLKLLFYTLILVNYSKQDAEVITKRKFVSKARSEYIKQRIKENQILAGGGGQPKIEANPPLKVPLCAYVEEKVPIEEDSPLNKTENGSLPFNDPELGGCVQCQMEPFEQCSAVPQKSCEFVKDPDCILCPSQPTLPKTRPIAFDITDQNEAFEKCDGSVSKDKFGRLIIYETKCKKFSTARCKLARNFKGRRRGGRAECRKREICYKKPRLLNGLSKAAAMKNMKCEKTPPRNLSLRKVLRRPSNFPEIRNRRDCQTNCPKKEVCRSVNVEKCETINVRICDRLPPERCQEKPKEPKYQRRIVLKCTEIAEIPADLLASLNGDGK